MNFGLTGPIADRGLLVEKDLIGIDVAKHRHRVNGLKDLATRDCPRMIAVLTQNCAGMAAWSAWSETTSRKNFNFSVRLGRGQATDFSAIPSHKTFLPQKKVQKIIPRQTSNLQPTATQPWVPARKKRIERFGRARLETVSEMSKLRGRTSTEVPKRLKPSTS
jgi:hypothetical protein